MENSSYNPSGNISVCGTSLQEWVKEGNDPGTSISTLPSDQQIIEWAKQLLS